MGAIMKFNDQDRPCLILSAAKDLMCRAPRSFAALRMTYGNCVESWNEKTGLRAMASNIQCKNDYLDFTLVDGAIQSQVLDFNEPDATYLLS